MYLLVYINKTSNMAIAEYGFYDYIEKRRAFLGEQDDIIGLMKIPLGWRDYFTTFLTTILSLPSGCLSSNS